MIKVISNKPGYEKLAAIIFFILIFTAGFLFIAGIVPKDFKWVGTAVLLIVQLLSALSDIKNRTISLQITIPALLTGICITTAEGRIAEGLEGAAAAFILMIFLSVISKYQVGGGDVMLVTVTGMYMGIGALFQVVFLSVILTGIYSSYLVFIKRVEKKTEIPFAPFNLVATIILVSIDSL